MTFLGEVQLMYLSKRITANLYYFGKFSYCILLRGVQLIYLIKVSTATVSKESKGIVSYIRYKIFSRFRKLYSFKCELLTKLGEFVPHLLGEVQFRYLTKECTANVSY